MICGLSRWAAACNAATLSTARKALSFFRKPMLFRFNSRSMKEERCQADDDRPEHFVANVEVVMGETADPMRQAAVVGILRGILWRAVAKRAALFRRRLPPISGNRSCAGRATPCSPPECRSGERNEPPVWDGSGRHARRLSRLSRIALIAHRLNRWLRGQLRPLALHRRGPFP